jgi:hypothetical protein
MIRNQKSILILTPYLQNNMCKKNIVQLVVFMLVCFIGCKNEKSLNFHLPNGQVVPQTTIQELEKSKKVHYEQYWGFILDYKDTAYKNALLIIESKDNIIGTDILKEYATNKLKSQKIKSIKLTYNLAKGKKEKDTLFEANIKKCYKDYDEEIKVENGFELRKNSQNYLKVEFHTFGNPNYSVLIFPVK